MQSALINAAEILRQSSKTGAVGTGVNDFNAPRWFHGPEEAPRDIRVNAQNCIEMDC